MRPAISGTFQGGTVPNNTTFSGNVQIDGTLGVTGVATFTTTVTGSGDIFAGASSEIGWTGRATMKSSADGVMTLFNDALSDFGRLNFGGTTSSFPALKRSSAVLQVRLGDDSAFGNISAASHLFNGATSGTLTMTPAATTTNHTLTLPANNAAGVLTNDGAGALSWAAAASGANTALSNLASVAINTTLVSDTDNTDDLGTASVRWANIYGVTGDFSGAADAIGASIDATTGLRLGSGKVLNFSSTTAFSGTADLGLARSAANILAITDGSSGYGMIRCTGISTDSAVAPVTGKVYVGAEAFALGSSPTYKFGHVSGIGWGVYDANVLVLGALSIGVQVKNDLGIGFGSTTPNGTFTTAWFQPAGGIMALGTTNATTGAALQMFEQTAPSAPAANGCRIYCVDNGGKTELLALFNSGAAQRLAIEP